MILVSSWLTDLVQNIDLDNVECEYDHTFTYSTQCDERSDWTFSYLKKLSSNVIPVSYCPIEVELTISSIEYSLREIDKYEVPRGKILIDATTLALPELLHLFHILKMKKKNFDVIYVQPTGYTENGDRGVDKIKSYDLSDDGLGIQQVPPYIGFSDNSMLFFFLGFEGHRFGALINSDEFDTSNITCLIGTPPFKLGWENKTLSNNYKQLLEINSNSNTRYKFAGANDPIKTYDHIDQVYRAADYEKRTLCLAPFGTKPAAIAAAQFAVNNKNVVMLYDYVKKKNKRSSGKDLVHRWSFSYVE
ncbi:MULTISPECIES: hypothetical protein [Pseudoalteromonas]|jgi:hypothetical protein|uniref:Uncharacterized protein n=1 Tax=Pseudoalteromonas neustonica TaxID=1840331 RepID=A0ABY3F749_9GAMM|nr:hypothetical protein [Pseudoalteromonas neustonica]TVU79705.1 hypothetical protein FQP85_22770 [Pseudoalteromonas neustonica]